MVYCGKPSRACHACRSRKTRCDARPEGCTQCKRAQRECPGYRVQADLIFRDQSTNVARKAKARESKKASDPSRSGSRTRLPEEGKVLSRQETEHSQEDEASSFDCLEIVGQQPFAGSYSLVPSLEDRAICYFISNYCIGMRSPGVGFLDSLEQLYQSNHVDPCLVASVKAAGLASYAHHARSRDLSNASQYQYMEAIQFTNAALGSPEDAKKDSTLVSIIILGIYEISTGCDQKSMKAWAEHINGAAALLELRGHAQTKTVAGRRLLMEVTNGILTNCLQRSIPIPEHVSWLVDVVYAAEGARRPELAMFKCILDVGGLISDIRIGKIAGVDAVVSRAKDIDRPLAAVCERPPPGWEFQRCYDDRTSSDIVFRGRFDVCLDLGYANLWNGIRMMRILVHEEVRNALLKHSAFAFGPPRFALLEHTAQFQEST